MCDPGVDRLVDGVGGERRGDEDHRRVRACARDRLGDGVEDRDALDVLAALARSDAGDELRAVGAVAQPVEATLASRSGPARRAACPCRRGSPSGLPSSPGSRSCRASAARRDALAPELAHALGLLALAARPREPGGEVDRMCRSTCTSSTRGPPPRGRMRATRPRCSCVRATDRGASRPPRPSSPMFSGVDEQHPVAATRAISATAAPGSSKWCAAVRQATTSKLAVREGERLGAADHVGAHARRGIAGDDLEPCLPQPPGHVPAAGARRRARSRHPPPSGRGGRGRRPRDGRRSRRRRRARSDQTIGASRRQLHRAPRRVEHRRLDVEVRGRRLGEDAPPLLGVRAVEAHDERASISISSSACRIPRATSSQRVMPPKMLKKIAFTCGSRVITTARRPRPARRRRRRGRRSSQAGRPRT